MCLPQRRPESPPRPCVEHNVLTSASPTQEFAAELCEALKDTLGAPLLRAYLATKVAEESALATRGLDEQVAALQHCY